MSTLTISRRIPAALSRKPEKYEIFVPQFTPPSNIIWEDSRSKGADKINTDEIVVTSYSKEYPNKPTPADGQVILEAFQKDSRFIQLDMWIMLNLLHTEINIKCVRMEWIKNERVPHTYNSGTFADSLVTNVPYGSFSGVTSFFTLGTIFEYKEQQHCLWAGFDADCGGHHPQPLYCKVANIKSTDDIVMLKA